MAPSNTLPVHGNEKTMNLNHLVLTNIQGSPYFKVNLFDLKTYHEVIDEIYYKVRTKEDHFKTQHIEGLSNNTFINECSHNKCLNRYIFVIFLLLTGRNEPFKWRLTLQNT